MEAAAEQNNLDVKDKLAKQVMGVAQPNGEVSASVDCADVQAKTSKIIDEIAQRLNKKQQASIADNASPTSSHKSPGGKKTLQSKAASPSVGTPKRSAKKASSPEKTDHGHF